MLNYINFLQDFEKAILESKRDIEEIDIIAVSKRKTQENIIPILDHGHTSFGENQIQELKQKWPSLRVKHKEVKIHFIGSIQSNKMSEIVNYSDYIHTIDREKLVNIIAQMDKSIIKKKTFFIQVNTGNEPQKSGVYLRQADEFIQLFKDKNLHVSGLMCIPPENEKPDEHFKSLQSIAKNNNIKNLSMGMTNDYHVALKYGSTHIRIGKAIFGERN
mgnify:CR=1 FL=1